MAVLESGEMYLETILILSEKLQRVRSVDISEYMGFSKPSVSRAMGLLKSGEYISVDQDGNISLLPLGMEIAQKIYDRHKLLSNVLISIGVSEKTAIEDACKLEHDISDESFNALKAHMEGHN